MESLNRHWATTPGGRENEFVDAYLPFAARTPVMKFHQVVRKSKLTWAALLCVNKDEGWWDHLGSGSLESLARRFIPRIGRDGVNALF